MNFEQSRVVEVFKNQNLGFGFVITVKIKGKVFFFTKEYPKKTS